MDSSIREKIPQPINSILAEIQYLVLDTIDSLLGRRDSLIPPRRLMYDGPRDPKIFRENGAEFFRYYVELCHLKPSEAILDVGCGLGRKTLPLINYLNTQGRYDGFDINKAGIEWCQRVISSRRPNFYFQWVDIYNQRYNPTGKHRAAEFNFPFPDETFDFVVLGSVFTHMMPAEVEHYLSEVARVLKKEAGRCLISFFLLNQETQALIEGPKSALTFKHDMGDFWVNDLALPENAVAYDEAKILDLYDKCGLKVSEPIYYGSWCGRDYFLSYQDLIVAGKP